MSSTLEQAREIAATVTDPELPMLTLEDLGVLRDVSFGAEGELVVCLTPTYSGCPAMAAMHDDVIRALRQEGFDRKVSRRDRFLVGEANPASLPLMTSSNHRLNNFIDGDMSIQHAWVAPDIQAYRRALAAEGITIPLDFAPESSYGVDQDIYSFYAMGNIETSIGSLPLRGNVGVRYEDTRRTVNTYITTDEPDTDTEAETPAP